MKNICRKAVESTPPPAPPRIQGGEKTRRSVTRSVFVILALMLLSACAVMRTPTIYRVALLAPFEGRYREIGYNALYAARMSFDYDGGDSPIWLELMPIDDGGSVETAILRARALTYDPQVIGALVLGYQAADPQVQAAFGDIPVIIVGRWTETRAADNVFILSSRAIHTPLDAVTAQIEPPYEGGDVWMLEGAPPLRESMEGITVVTSGSLPDANFTERYKADNQFAPEPYLLAPLVRKGAFILRVAVNAGDRAVARELIRTGEYALRIDTTFGEDGYWNEAPVNRYQYTDAGWVEVES